MEECKDVSPPNALTPNPASARFPLDALGPNIPSRCGKERRILFDPWRPAKEALVRNYIEVYWPYAGGLSAVNAIGTQLRDPIP